VRGATDRVWLARSDTRGADSILLHEGATAAAVPFAPGARIDAAADVRLPIDVSGAWFVVVETDALNTVIEPGAEADNIRAAAIDVALAPYANLVVTALTVADPATVTIGWTVENQGTGRGSPTPGWTASSCRRMMSPVTATASGSPGSRMQAGSTRGRATSAANRSCCRPASAGGSGCS
jgi:hypothetical protein